MNKLPTLTVVVPCYNEESALPLFYAEISKIIKEMSTKVKTELLFIDDGSTDKTREVLSGLAQKDQKLSYLSFSRNFGKEAAILAGLEHATGQYVILMDADLQHPPRMIPKMFQTLEETDCDVVGLRRVTRKGEPPIRSFFARRFYKLIDKMSQIEMVDGACDFRLMTRPVVDALISCHEYNRYSKGLFGFVGFKTEWLEYENVKRIAGETKWSFWQLCSYAIEGIVSFSTAPLIISAWLGIIFCITAVIAIIVIVVRTIAFGDPVGSWPSMMCAILFIGGIQLLSIGILGEYLSKTYLETKKRPIYIIDERHSHVQKTTK